MSDPSQPLGAVQEQQWQRLYNIVAELAHPNDDHRENPLEDEAHDLIRALRASARGSAQENIEQIIGHIQRNELNQACAKLNALRKAESGSPSPVQPEPTEAPKDSRGRLMLNAYGRACFDKGRESAHAKINELIDALKSRVCGNCGAASSKGTETT